MIAKCIGDVLRELSPSVALVHESASVADAIEKMLNHGVGYCLVSQTGKATAILTERDILTRVVARGFAVNEVLVGSVATSPVITVRPETPVLVALDLMAENHFRCLPVQEGEIFIGAVSMMGLMEWLAEEMSTEADDLATYIVGPSIALKLPGHARRRRGTSSSYPAVVAGK